MNFRTHNDGPIDSHGCSLQGYITASIVSLARAFGRPIGHGRMCEPITTEWKIRFEDGQIATIYDWNESPVDHEDVVHWHVGGLNRQVVERVHEAFRAAHPALRKVA